jgi:hypothetical protein
LLLASFLLLPLAACSDGGSDSEAAESGAESQPWKRQFTLGNFAINSGPIVTNEDGVSADYMADYVKVTALPSANFEYFSVNANLPSTSAIETRLSDFVVTVGRTDGTRTANIYKGGEFLETTDMGDGPYSVYRLDGFTVASPAITPGTFANVVFEFTVTYRKDGEALHTARRKIEVFKR